MNDDEELKRKRRKEKLEAWKRKKELEQKKGGKGFGTIKIGSNAKRKSVAVFDADDDDDEKDKRKRLLLKIPLNVEQSTDKVTESNDVDPLEQFMHSVTSQVDQVDQLEQQMEINDTDAKSDDNEFDLSESGDEGIDDILAIARKKLAAKKKDIPAVNHGEVGYAPFEKSFYVEPTESSQLSKKELAELRLEMGGIEVRGRKCPKPCLKWTWLGLSPSVYEIITTVLKYEKPTPIQSQAIPAIMSGFDVLGVAKTGSGKTMAFLLPMFRHIKAQRPVGDGEGPIALIMTPTRELAVQIYRECRLFKKALGINSVCAYGGSSIREQISDLKRGTDVLIGTPGRLIDLLAANSGRVTNLRRVTFLVLDEADRMFDMGFEPQVMKIVQNIRPDRQTVLFSATFPRQMEALARKALVNPIEILVGGKGAVCRDVSQHVLVVGEADKFNQLLLLLGRWHTASGERALVFVDRQEAADTLLHDLQRRGYVCGSLHGGKDQLDRDSAIKDFKDGVFDILVATSLAARGLDVKQLTLVVNYDSPNHMEDYIHRCGRTGRAGNKGAAYTFVTPDQGKFAVEIEKALIGSDVAVPDDLKRLCDSFKLKVKEGKEHFVGSGFKGKGLDHLSKERDLALKQQKASLRGTGEFDFSEDEHESEDEVGAGNENRNGEESPVSGSALPFSFVARAVGLKNKTDAAAVPVTDNLPEHLRLAREAASKIALSAGMKVLLPSVATGAGGSMQTAISDDVTADYAYEIDINDFPQKARWSVTNKDLVRQITDTTRAQIKTKGTFIPAGKEPNPGERKLYLLVEGESLQIVDHAKNEIKRILTNVTLKSVEFVDTSVKGRYSVVD